MKIKNTTTGQVETLIYAPTGCDCLPDLIAADPTVGIDEEEEIKSAPQDSIDFWREWIAKAEQADALEAEVAEKLGDKYAAAEMSADAVDGVEFNDQPAARIDALTKALSAD